MLEHFIDSRGIVLRRDLIRAGYDDGPIKRAVKAEELERIRSGACCVKAIWDDADRIEKHRLLSHAVARQYGDDVARSHVSALLEFGGPDWGVDLRNVHLTNLYGIGERTQAGVVHHRGTVRVGDLTRRDDTWLTSDARTALDAASIAPRDPAVSILTGSSRRGTRPTRTWRPGSSG